MRLRLEYFDQNEEFTNHLPQTGTVERFVKSAENDVWALFKLDSSINYENRSISHLLLKSRWRKQRVGESEPTSVFICLVDDVQKAVNGLSIDDFEQVAWGMVYRK